MDKSHFFTFNGYVSRVKNDDKIYYHACPLDTCRRKVYEDNGGWRCEKCATTHTSFNPTYMIQAKISDFSDSIYVNFSREQGEFLIGKSAAELKTFKATNSEEVVSDYFD